VASEEAIEDVLGGRIDILFLRVELRLVSGGKIPKMQEAACWD